MTTHYLGDWPAKCTVCGKFIGISEFICGEIGGDFTPDSHFTREEINHWHKSCEPEDVEVKS